MCTGPISTPALASSVCTRGACVEVTGGRGEDKKRKCESVNERKRERSRERENKKDVVKDF
jgi:hypothetical protein